MISSFIVMSVIVLVKALAIKPWCEAFIICNDWTNFIKKNIFHVGLSQKTPILDYVFFKKRLSQETTISENAFLENAYCQI